jgi:hypothetical protein
MSLTWLLGVSFLLDASWSFGETRFSTFFKIESSVEESGRTEINRKRNYDGPVTLICFTIFRLTFFISPRHMNHVVDQALFIARWRSCVVHVGLS